MRYNVKGFLVYRPWSTIPMKLMFKIYEEELDKFGHQPVIFPSVIPESNFEIEKEHVEGFAPEVFWVTTAGKEEQLDERLALRPTSETAMYPLYSYWIRSWRDLPLKLYQSGKVWRYEGKSTRPFLRGREFIWIESHNVFATLEEARAQTREDMQISMNAMWEHFGIPFIQLKRPKWDKFAGAVDTYASDTLMPDGKFLQLPSTHLLGDNFSKAFNIYYTDQEGNKKVVYQTCYGPGISRIFGAMVAVHGDDNGLIFPFEIAPLQIVIIPIPRKNTIKEIAAYCQELEQSLKRRYRVKTDLGDERPGDKYFFWEMKGVPLRLEIGQREAETRTVTIFRRDTREKQTLSQEEFHSIVDELGAEITINLKMRAEEEFQRRLVIAKNWEELETAIVNRKVVKIAFCSIEAEGEECAMEVKDNLAATVRGTDVQEIDTGITPKKSENCLICRKPAQCYVYVGKQY